MNTRKLLIAAAGLVVAFGGAASAQTNFDNAHPRRAEVNARLANQDARIHAERADGEMTAARAHRLHRADRHIRREARRVARHHQGHISRAEEHRLNRQENAVSNRIGH